MVGPIDLAIDVIGSIYAFVCSWWFRASDLESCPLWSDPLAAMTRPQPGMHRTLLSGAEAHAPHLQCQTEEFAGKDTETLCFPNHNGRIVKNRNRLEPTST
jgi:hypothetical protein